LPDDQPPRLKRGILLRFLVGGVLIVLLSAGTTLTFTLETVSKVAHDLTLGGQQIKSPALTADQAGAAQTILVIGSDRRAQSKDVFDRSDPPHTDTILLVRMDPGQGQTSVLSVPRDLLVSFNGPKGFYPDQKINAAYTYGGAPLTLKVLEQTLPGLKINHVIDLNFSSFRQVVDAIGCVYVDVDRRYYNLNVGTPETDYANINVQPGYQKLCGQTALDYVRFRHTDSDFVRVARQQDFIRQAKEQVGVTGLLNNYGQITSAFGRAVLTDIRGTTDVLRLLKLAAFSLGRPLRQVKFQVASENYTLDKASFVESTPTLIAATLKDFLHGDEHVHISAKQHAPAGPAGSSHRRAHPATGSAPAAVGLYALDSGSLDQIVAGLVSVPFRPQLPRYQTGPAHLSDIHAYAIRDEQGHLHHGYRVDWRQNIAGSYYGVEAMDWTTPPLFAHPTETLHSGGRTYLLIDDGSHIHDVGWREHGVLYWVSNTWLEDLSNPQMLTLARTTHSLR
jgi:polyisoprenyl-teichoic acid--peptidoglycan teichoic acid transferase